MNPVPLFLIIVTLPLLLWGCGREEPVGKVPPVEEKVLEVKEEAKTEAPVTQVKPQLGGVNMDKLEEREGIAYLKGSDTPYTGKATRLYENGQKQAEANYKGGKKEGLQTYWHKNGQKREESNYKNGKPDGQWLGWYENGQKKSEEASKAVRCMVYG